MAEARDYLTPDYYPEYHCKMGACRSACCEGWPISISMEDYFRLLGLSCSPELRSRLDAGIHPALHPTPAVSGLERSAALDFIRTTENLGRRYYSGFCGPTDPVGGTQLYVTLRSAAIDAERGEATLWAGGGIMPDSRLEEEWAEVVQKMHTVNLLFDHV